MTKSDSRDVDILTMEGISFDETHHRPESHSLQYLWVGLCFLYKIVKSLEERRVKERPQELRIGQVSFDAECNSGDPVLLNYFLWYSTSADSFLDLFEKSFPGIEDTKVQFAAVRLFRDKVAAHFSHVNPGKGKYEDNQETQSASLRQCVSWDFGMYSVGGEVTTNCSTGERSPLGMGWQLTKTHEAITRYLLRNLPKA